MRPTLIAAAVMAVASTAGHVGPALAQGEGPGVHFVENWDLDGDGTVTLAELEEHRADVFYMFDENEDGMLAAAEYTLFDETRAADMANNGGVHGQGKGQGNGQGAMQRASDGMSLAFNDTDGDGAVSEAEFIGKSGDWMELLDRNGDGVVTTDDFGRH